MKVFSPLGYLDLTRKSGCAKNNENYPHRKVDNISNILVLLLKNFQSGDFPFDLTSGMPLIDPKKQEMA